MKKEQDIHRLRSFLMDSPCTALIGTSPVYFPGLYSNKSPFYDFFSISPLENLSEDETAELIRKNLEWEGRDDILQNFDDFLPKNTCATYHDRRQSAAKCPALRADRP